MTLWTPAQIPVAQRLAWYDAQDASTITLNGGDIAQINDKWGSGRNQVQSTAANQPAYNPTGFNGRPSISAGTADKWLFSQFAPLDLTQARIFVVGRRTIDSQFATLGSSSSVAPFLRASSGWGTQARGNTAALVGSPNIALLDTQNRILCLGFSGSEVFFRLDGVRASTASSAIGAMTINRIALFTQAMTTSLGVSGLTVGDVGEVIVVTGSLSLAEEELIEGYLAWKWGLQASLPANHPYKIGAPLPVEAAITATVPVVAAAQVDVIVPASIAAEVPVAGSASAVTIIEGAVAANLEITVSAFGGTLSLTRPRHRFIVPPALSQGALRSGARPSGGLAGYSFTAEAKDPEAVLGYEMDWGEWLSEGETLVQAAKVRATGNVEIAFERVEEGRFVRWRVSGGEAGEDAFITITIDTSSGQTDERTIRLPVRER